MTNRIMWTITALMAATIFRAQTVLFLSSVEAFGGPAPNAWFGPWASDAALGFLVPAMLYILWTQQSIRAWGLLVVYNSLGVFDYAHGLVTQFFHPMPAEMASSATVYAGIGVFMVCQSVALVLLFRADVASQFRG